MSIAVVYSDLNLLIERSTALEVVPSKSYHRMKESREREAISACHFLFGPLSSTCRGSKKHIKHRASRTIFHLMFLVALQRRHVSAWLSRHVTYSRPSYFVHASASRCFSSPSNQNNEHENRKKPNTKKFKVVDEISDEHMDKLAAAFDELARKEGFDDSDAFFAKDSTFEDPFADDDNFDLDDDFSFDYEIDDESNDGIDGSFTDDSDTNDMNTRIAAASQGVVGPAPKTKTSRKDDSLDSLKELGFRKEKNPWGNDETDRREGFKLMVNAMTCSACGADFQNSNEQRPGFLPLEKYELQKKLSELEKLNEKSKSKEWTPEEEVEWLVRTMDNKGDDVRDPEEVDIEAAAEKLELDLDSIATQKKTICKRCHGLQNFGTVDANLRPGWTDEPLLSQEKFRSLLKPLSEKPAVIVALVDLFDFSGSVLPELDNIAGENPVILVANKVDLLPSQMGLVRAENWVRRELEYLGISSLANIGGAVQLVSCKTGMGIDKMMAKARSLSAEIGGDIYLVGAANAGKSTLLNRILDWQKNDDLEHTKKRAGNRNARKGAVTTSPLPGTTLKFIDVDIGNGVKLVDTPGLLVNGTLTQLLTPEELKIVVPQSRVEPITFRLASGKCVLIGGLARIELIKDSKPFLFTFFVANQIKLHPTDASRAEEIIQKHVGELLTPPLPPGRERLEAFGEFEEHVLTVEGSGWKEAAADISLTGLGFISVMGAGTATVKIVVPKGIRVSLRPPLMPFDIWDSTARYTGSRSVRKTSGSGKRRGVGRN